MQIVFYTIYVSDFAKGIIKIGFVLIVSVISRCERQSFIVLK